MNIEIGRTVRRSALALMTAAALAGASGAAEAGVLAAYDFENANIGDLSAAASSVGAGVTASSFGFVGFQNLGVKLLGSTQYFDFNFPTANTDYFTFSLTTTGPTSVTSISFDIGQNDINGGVTNPVDHHFVMQYALNSAFTGAVTMEGFTVFNPGPAGVGNSSFDLDNHIVANNVPLFGPADTYYFRIMPTDNYVVGTTQVIIDNIVVNGTVPEPGSLALLGLGLTGLGFSARRKKA